MKKIISMIGIGAALFMAPACRKSNIQPRDVTESTEAQSRVPSPQDPQQANNTTTMYVMLTSKACATPQKEYTSVTVGIRGVRIFTAENGWQPLMPFTNGWELISLQQGTIPGLNITERTLVNPGTITKIAFSFSDNNKLEINNKPVSCFKLATQEVIVDMKGEIKKNAVNELLVNMDICGHFGVQTNADGSRCYVLKPDVQFERVTQKMIK